MSASGKLRVKNTGKNWQKNTKNWAQGIHNTILSNILSSSYSWYLAEARISMGLAAVLIQPSQGILYISYQSRTESGVEFGNLL